MSSMESSSATRKVASTASTDRKSVATLKQDATLLTYDDKKSYTARDVTDTPGEEDPRGCTRPRSDTE